MGSNSYFIIALAAVAAYLAFGKKGSLLKSNPRRGKRKLKGPGKKRKGRRTEEARTDIKGTGNSPTRTSTSTSGKDI